MEAVEEEYSRLELRRPYRSITTLVSTNLPQVTVLTGKNGSGKTQLLEAISNGSVVVNIGSKEIEQAAIRFVADPSKFVRGQGDSASSLRLTDPLFGESLFKIVKRFTETVSSSIDDFSIDDVSEFIKRQKEVHRSSKQVGNGSRVLQRFDPKVINYLNKITEFEKDLLQIMNLIQLSAGESIFRLNKTDFVKYAPVAGQLFRINTLFKPWFLDYRNRQRDNDLRRLEVERDGSDLEWFSDEEFENLYGPAPWHWINELLSSFEFRFRINYPSSTVNEYEPKVESASAGYSIDELSSGECVILGLIASLGLGVSKNISLAMPKLWLLDEPDAHLHPSLAQSMIHLIEYVARERDIAVILTTHSPSTVALASEGAIHVISDNLKTKELQKVDHDFAIVSLTSGVPTLSVRKENERQIIVESDNDAEIYTQALEILERNSAILYNPIRLNFISSGSKTRSGNCDQAIALCDALRSGGSSTAFALVDFDSGRDSTEIVRVMGGGVAYAIENLILCPIVLIGLILHRHGQSVDLPFFCKDLRFSAMGQLSDAEIQSYSDAVCEEMKQKIVEKRISSRTYLKAIAIEESEHMAFEFQGGRSVNLPEWFLLSRGHDIAALIRDTFPSIRRYSPGDSDTQLMKNALSYVLAEFPAYFPQAMTNTFIQLRE